MANGQAIQLLDTVQGTPTQLPPNSELQPLFFKSWPMAKLFNCLTLYTNTTATQFKTSAAFFQSWLSYSTTWHCTGNPNTAATQFKTPAAFLKSWPHYSTTWHCTGNPNTAATQFKTSAAFFEMRAAQGPFWQLSCLSCTAGKLSWAIASLPFTVSTNWTAWPWFQRNQLMFWIEITVSITWWWPGWCSLCSVASECQCND